MIQLLVNGQLTATGKRVSWRPQAGQTASVAIRGSSSAIAWCAKPDVPATVSDACSYWNSVVAPAIAQVPGPLEVFGPSSPVNLSPIGDEQITIVSPTETGRVTLRDPYANVLVSVTGIGQNSWVFFPPFQQISIVKSDPSLPVLTRCGPPSQVVPELSSGCTYWNTITAPAIAQTPGDLQVAGPPIDKPFDRSGAETVLIRSLTPGATVRVLDPFNNIVPGSSVSGVGQTTWQSFTAFYTYTIVKSDPNARVYTRCGVDLTPPELAVPDDITVPATSADGATVAYDLPAAYDDYDGLLPPTCTGPTGGPLPLSGSTFPIGSSRYNCAAADRAGNQAESKGFTVNVTCDWSGFLPPINPPIDMSRFKAGRTIPVKFKLQGGCGFATGLPATFSFTRVSAPTGAVNEAPIDAAATTGTLFRYDPSAGQYIYNWSTKGLPTGTYVISANVGDGVTRTTTLGLS